MKGLLVGAVILIVLFIIGLNSSLIGDQALSWAKANPKDPNAPQVLYDAGRWCDIMGSDNKAVALYWFLYQQYPQNAELCAPALYNCGKILANSSYIVGIRQQAIPYLQIVLTQYQDQEEWKTKSKQLLDEVTYVHQ